MRSDELIRRLRLAPILPIVRVASVENCLRTIDLLAEGGVLAVEILLRTAEAPAALTACRNRHPTLLIGAGTVLSPTQLDEAVARGAQFTISPGFLPLIAEAADRHGIGHIPGVQTASEVMAAHAAGLALLKYYPAETSNGRAVLDDYSSIFPDVRFVPTGKINDDNFLHYARLSSVVGVGGSWLHGSGAADTIAERVRSAIERFREANSAAGNRQGDDAARIIVPD
jgi:2-dehydro-3-deoxyphosphogluconate aldolase/(4S)-4-hydroxy-2-oxoglutarate aldolase